MTVDVKNSTVLHQRFLTLCQQIQAKALEIVLAQGTYPKQMMFSKIITTSHLQELFVFINQWVRLFQAHHLDVLRTKIEIPLHSNYLNHIQYYEWHALIEYHHVEQLQRLCHDHGAHLSYNALKWQPKFRFITLRESHSIVHYRARVGRLRQALIDQKYTPHKEIHESCIYDSNDALDQGWLI